MKVAYSFSDKDIKNLLERAFRTWGLHLNYLSVSYDSGAQQPSGTVGCTVRGNRESFGLTGGVISAAVLEASAAAGNPLDQASLQFRYNEGHGYGESPSISAAANEGAFQPNQTIVTPGKVKFPGTVTTSLEPQRLKNVLQQAAERAGHKVTWVSISHRDRGLASARISITKNGISSSIDLDAAQLEAEIIEEMGHRGYDVQPGITYHTGESGFGNSGDTYASLKVTGIPK